MDALFLLAAYGGKIIILYAALAGIPCDSTPDIMAHEKFKSSEYQQMRTFYNSLASKCGEIIKKKGKFPSVKQLLH